MSIVKKLTFLVLLFICFIIYSVFSFDYESHSSNNSSTASQLKKTENKQANEGTLNKITNTFTSSTVEKKDSKPVSISLYKKDGLIVMDGVFASPEENKVIFNILNINRDGVYSYDENIVADQNLISKIAILIPAFKEFFEDNSSIIVKNNEVFLTGALKDSTHNVLLENTILKSTLKLIKDVKVPEPILIAKEELKPEIKQENTKSLSLNDIQAMINELVAANKISFERRSSTITANSQATLIQISKILQEYNQVKIEIGGHTDSRGDNALNKQISQDRANSVKESLVSMGINKDRLTAVGYGEDFPIAKDDADGLSEINRRVEFNIVGE